MMKKLLLFCCLVGLAASAAAQVGGISTYEFLNLPNSATLAAMGGHHIALQDDDLSLAARNPALLNPLHHRRLTLSHAFHPVGISNSYLAYGYHHAKSQLTYQAGLQYASFGNDLVRRDATGQNLGTFSANDYALTVGASRKFDGRLTLGVNLKLINSQLAEYNSFGLATDLAVHYQDSTGRFGLSLVARNVGRQLSRYGESGSAREPLPYELQIGINRQLEHLPFRFSLIYRYLDRWNVLYDDPNATEDNVFLNFDGESGTTGAGSRWFDNFFRHFVFNGELLVGRGGNLRLRFGYNHGLRKELTLVDYRSLAGYSGGFALRVQRFQIAYGRTTYHIGGGINQLGLDFDLGRKR